jgi:L-aspartate oxidase
LTGDAIAIALRHNIKLENPDYDSFMEDTLKAGHYENRRESVDIMIRSSREVINELIGYGVDFAKQENGELNYTREGCHSKARILFHEDITGKEITRNLLKAVQKLPNVHILEYVTMLDLIEQDNTCFGILAKDKNDEYLTIEADNTILASGGIGGLYEHSTNYPHLTGDAIAIALRHNIKLENPDYVQIHPTSLYTNKPGRSFLISESVRGEGAKLYGKDGKRFANEVLPRDLMTAEIKKQMAKDNMPYVWLDMTVLGKDVILNHFPHIYEKCLEEGFDVTRQWIPIVPAQHYYMGGIHVDKYSKTTMNNLYAVGETSCNGVHGANRLASNSLLEGLVFAKRAVNKIHDDENAQHKKYDIDFAQLANNVQQNIDREKIILAQEYKKAIFNEMDKVRSAR